MTVTQSVAALPATDNCRVAYNKVMLQMENFEVTK